jgi:hypothetical protein
VRARTARRQVRNCQSGLISTIRITCFRSFTSA